MALLVVVGVPKRDVDVGTPKDGKPAAIGAVDAPKGLGAAVVVGAPDPKLNDGATGGCEAPKSVPVVAGLPKENVEADCWEAMTHIQVVVVHDYSTPGLRLAKACQNRCNLQIGLT